MSPFITTALFIAGFFAIAFPASIIFLALRISKTLSITVQAPTALLPERVADTLRALEEKLKPVEMSASDDYLRELVSEGVTLAGESSMRGPDRFRIARTHVERRLKAMELVADMGDVAQRIEAEVARRKVVDRGFKKAGSLP